ncbi:mitochondrial 4-hydroxybenzoate polyprenyltransferase [Triangularia verruculosa]|uniref:Mitochondrial 4-hydroxybenzoate polyprenyltransferase n=1 Tax=Triangularia verruculosa TaxID=2587418 RepID=A0AAN6XGW3_9PEZI|nr:mitochondrial 4-hydroxybenzoate polyprenyltransferase [Triangularia verruculosa]
MAPPTNPEKQPPSIPSYTPPTSFPLSLIPSSWIPFAELIRLHQPHGLYMTYFPNLLGLLYASCAHPSGPIPPLNLAHSAASLLLWTFLFRSVGCAWNDIIDQDYDRKTTRCKNRPLARRAISTPSALAFTLVLLLLSLASLEALVIGNTPSKNDNTKTAIRMLGPSLLAQAAVYPFGKRFTHFAQVVLGTTLATSVPLAAYAVGVPALEGEFLLPTGCFAGVVVLLVVFYDVVYARQDTADDLANGVKGMAVRFRDHLEVLFAVVTVGIVGLAVVAGAGLGAGRGYYLFSVGVVGVVLVLVVARTRWGFLSSWQGSGGWWYAFAVGNLMLGLAVEDWGRRQVRGIV